MNFEGGVLIKRGEGCQFIGDGRDGGGISTRALFCSLQRYEDGKERARKRQNMNQERYSKWEHLKKKKADFPG